MNVNVVSRRAILGAIASLPLLQDFTIKRVVGHVKFLTKHLREQRWDILAHGFMAAEENLQIKLDITSLSEYLSSASKSKVHQRGIKVNECAYSHNKKFTSFNIYEDGTLSEVIGHD